MNKKTICIVLMMFSIVKTYAQQWTTDASTSSVTLTTPTYNVGIGIQPTEKLHINGAIRGNSTGGALRVSTINGYVDLGPQNATYSHFTTDRSGFFFSNPVYLGNGMLSSNTSIDLKLQTGGTTRLTLSNTSGNLGLGIDAPLAKLHIGGEILLESATPAIYTNKTSTDANKYLHVYNSPLLAVPVGLKAGGLLVADASNYADPGKNNLVVKGAVGIGNTLTTNPNNYSLLVGGKVNASSFYINDQEVISSQWTTTNSNVFFNGGVGIGTNLSNNPQNYKLAVNGRIGAKDVRVENTSATWPDYVFESTYNLPSLTEVEEFIKENKHLSDVPSAQEIKKEGHDLGAMDAVLLKKIEELTLYVIDLKKDNEELKKRLEIVENK